MIKQAVATTGMMVSGHLHPVNIIKRANHFPSSDALLKNISNIPRHKASLFIENLSIANKAYSAKIYLQHYPMFFGVPDDGDIKMSVEAIAVHESKCPDSHFVSFLIVGADAQALTSTLFDENDGLEQRAMTHCVNKNPELSDILRRYREAHPNAEVKIATSNGSQGENHAY